MSLRRWQISILAGAISAAFIVIYIVVLRGSSPAESEPAAVLRRFWDALNHGNPAAAAQFFTQDGVFEDSHGSARAWSGRKVIRKLIRGFLVGHEFRVRPIDFKVSGDTVTGRAEFSVEGQDPIVQIAVAKVRDGKISLYRILWDLTDPKSAQAAASQGYVHDAPGSDAIAVPLGPWRDAYQAGTAFLDRFEDLAWIITDIAPGPTGAFQPVHIHSGSCAELGPVVYRLGSLPGPGLEPVGVGVGYVPGKMSTLLDADLSKLLSGEFAIEVHESEEKQGVSVACGDIGKARHR